MHQLQTGASRVRRPKRPHHGMTPALAQALERDGELEREPELREMVEAWRRSATVETTATPSPSAGASVVRFTRAPRRTAHRQPGRRVRRAASSTGGTGDDPGEGPPASSASRDLKRVA
jgi:hypothetical protein